MDVRRTGLAGSVAGSLLTAIVLAVSIYFAWRGITQQLHITLINREEDRIEAGLPGLHYAEEVLSMILLQLEDAVVLESAIQLFRAYDIGVGTNLDSEGGSASADNESPD